MRPGSYRFQFPVWVPGRMPRNNVWLITLCGPAHLAKGGACLNENSPRAFVTFPLSGFELNEVHPSTANDGAVSGAPSALVPYQWAAVLATLLSVLVARA